MKKIDLTGEKYHRLTVIEEVVERQKNSIMWRCVCDCGNTVHVSGGALRSGNTQSCGCQKLEKTVARNRKHGMCKSPEHAIWASMKARCNNPRSSDYKNYGARGIAVCSRWEKSFSSFLRDMGTRPSSSHSIDRIDNNCGYEPGNCRWATSKEQSRNQRSNTLITINGETKILSDWAISSGLTVSGFLRRMERGLTGESLINTPINGRALITFDGITDSISGWSRRTGIAKNTLRHRIKVSFWPVERALTEGVEK
jgi:hypothetical protein